MLSLINQNLAQLEFFRVPGLKMQEKGNLNFTFDCKFPHTLMHLIVTAHVLPLSPTRPCLSYEKFVVRI
jgi:hypothetical protein